MLGLTPMAPGGRWMRPVHDAPPVYIPAKQIEAHYKRLVGDGWTPMEDPRSEDQHAHALVQAEVQTVSNEIAMQSRIDQLEALVRQQSELVNRLLAQKSEHDGSTSDTGRADSESSDAHKRSGGRKSAV